MKAQKVVDRILNDYSSRDGQLPSRLRERHQAFLEALEVPRERLPFSLFSQ